MHRHKSVVCKLPSSLCINNESSISRQRDENREMQTLMVRYVFARNTPNFPRRERLHKQSFMDFSSCGTKRPIMTHFDCKYVAQHKIYNSRLAVKQLPRLRRCSDATRRRYARLHRSSFERAQDVRCMAYRKSSKLNVTSQNVTMQRYVVLILELYVYYINKK